MNLTPLCPFANSMILQTKINLFENFQTFFEYFLKNKPYLFRLQPLPSPI